MKGATRVPATADAPGSSILEAAGAAPPPQGAEGGEMPMYEVFIASIVFSLMAGIVIIADSVASLAFAYAAPHFGAGQYYNGLPFYFGFGPYLFGVGNQYWYFTFAAIDLVVGSVIIAGVAMLYLRPGLATAWGAMILVASVIGLFGVGDFFLTQMFGVIGGFLALSIGRRRRALRADPSLPANR